VLILGGGVNGAGIARDLALRARESGLDLQVGLIEQRQFGSGTSGKNSHLIHGGLRYLKNLEFRLVREALRERAILLRVAPHLIEPLRFLMPINGRFARVQYGCGLWLYDLLAGDWRIGRHAVVDVPRVREIEPGLDTAGLTCGAMFCDARVYSARFVLANVWDAVRHGAAAANYVVAEGWNRDGRVWRVALRDTISGEQFETRARKLVDTTGPWSAAGGLRLVRGSHIVLPRASAGPHAIADFDAAGRILFVIPWGEAGGVSLVGTTEVDHEAGPEDVRISGEELRYLTARVRRLFPAADLHPCAAFSSLRPLLRGRARSSARTSREHRIWNEPDGVLHVAGGKYTTYRLMSEEAADLAVREVAPRLAGVHLTADRAIDVLPPGDFDAPVRPYGSGVLALLALQPDMAPPGLSRLQAARVAYAVRHEMAHRLADLLLVSTWWGYEQPALVDPSAREMARLLGWDEPQTREEIRLVRCLTALPPS
jgi:glycerol-3-phosphate dehydrogenase